MAKLPLELFSLDRVHGSVGERINRFYEKLLGLCRWFHSALNGVVFPVEPGDPILNTSYLGDLVAGRNGLERERIEQFTEQFQALLEENGLAYEGIIELLGPDMSSDTWSLVRVAYAARPFWRWY